MAGVGCGAGAWAAARWAQTAVEMKIEIFLLLFERPPDTGQDLLRAGRIGMHPDTGQWHVTGTLDVWVTLHASRRDRWRRTGTHRAPCVARVRARECLFVI